MTKISFPNELQKIPQDYFKPFTGPKGRLISLTYDTYESFSYDEHSQILHKRAIVYLPAGYDDAKPYNVFYLMHGGWSDETTYLGVPGHSHEFKNVLDQAMADGVVQPMIVVCPTYNNLNDKDSFDYSLALKLTNNYHHELVNDLMPAVEGRFSTYAADTSPAGLKASRDHRAFTGFSMGSVTTWRTFEYCLAYFRYFFPSSGSVSTNRRLLEHWVRQQGFRPDDFFIFAASGTQDFAYSGIRAQIQAMAQSSDIFHYANNSDDGNLYFLVAPGGVHGPANALEDFYNAMLQLWKVDDHETI